MKISDIPIYKLPWNESVVYWKLSELKKLYEVSLVEEDGFYLLSEKIEDYGLNFACFETCGGADDDWLTLIARGSICHVDGKKEIRHIHWGEEGYIFYFDIDKGLKMLNYLKEYLQKHGHDF